MTLTLELDRVAVELAGRRVLQNVSLAVTPGEMIGVLGVNGAGKSTLLRAALGLAPLADGVARLSGRRVERLSEPQRSRLAAYLPQDRRVAWNLPAWRVAALGALSGPADSTRRTAMAALEEVGVDGLAERGVLDMSGGERTKVLLARLIATRAPLLVADEPIAGLDPSAQFLVLDILRRRADFGAAVIVTLHDLTLAARACHRVAVLSKGRLVALGSPTETLTPTLVASVFGLTGALIASEAGLVLAAKRSA